VPSRAADPHPPRGHPDAIVRPRAGQAAFTVDRLPPSSDLAAFVDYHWLVRWQVDGEHRQQVVPQPRIHLAAEAGRLFVHGTNRAPFYRLLRGRGLALGTAFHPGGFRPFVQTPVSALTDRVVPAGDVFGQDDRPVAAAVQATEKADEMVAAVEQYLLALEPWPDPAGDRVSELVRMAEQDTSVTRAEELARRAGVSLRTLQRLFTSYLGVGPKWVIQRFRLLDAAAAAHAGRDVPWADLALELGFADQAHLTRVFSRVVGTPPATYARDPGTNPPAHAP
jgi:AraC-like DNA-binding protein